MYMSVQILVAGKAGLNYYDESETQYENVAPISTRLKNLLLCFKPYVKLLEP